MLRSVSDVFLSVLSDSSRTQTDEDLAFLMGNDSDSFNRWEAGQKLFGKYVLQGAQVRTCPALRQKK